MLITLSLTIGPDYLLKKKKVKKNKKSMKTQLLHAKYIALNNTQGTVGLFAYSQCHCEFAGFSSL